MISLLSNSDSTRDYPLSSEYSSRWQSTSRMFRLHSTMFLHTLSLFHELVSTVRWASAACLLSFRNALCGTRGSFPNYLIRRAQTGFVPYRSWVCACNYIAADWLPITAKLLYQNQGSSAGRRDLPLRSMFLSSCLYLAPEIKSEGWFQRKLRRNCMS